MHIEKPSTLASLLRITVTVTNDLSLHDDLYQEALIHLWLTEMQRPNQTESWYLQSCKFHLQHYLASGRSVDSRKRRVGQWYREARIEEADELPDQDSSPNPVFALVSTRDLISLLSRQLLPREKAVLDGLVDGLGMREIGRRLNISHTMALRHRAKIARLLLKLERPSLFPSLSLLANEFDNNGTKHFNETKRRTRLCINGIKMRINSSRPPTPGRPLFRFEPAQGKHLS